jgi:hypothetical protein
MNTYRFFHWTIPARNNEEFIERLWLTSYTETRSLKQYMEEVAERAFKAYGALVRTSSATVFVNDMIRAGYLHIEQNTAN